MKAQHKPVQVFGHANMSCALDLRALPILRRGALSSFAEFENDLQLRALADMRCE